MNVTVKNIPDEVMSSLKALAAHQGRSLNSQILQILAREAELEKRRESIRANAKQLERFVQSQRPQPSSVTDLRRERERR